MNQVVITEENREAFSDVLPGGLTEKNRVSIGAYDDEGVICGALSATQSQDRYVIDWIYVAESRRREGIGTALTETLVGLARHTGGCSVVAEFEEDRDEDDGGIYDFFVQIECDGMPFDLSYLYNRYYITPEELERMSSEKKYKAKGVYGFFDLPVYEQKNILARVSSRYEVRDYEKWAESCEKKFCRVAATRGKISALIIITKRSDNNIELSYLQGSNPKLLILLVFDTAGQVAQEFPNAKLIFDTVTPEAEAIAQKLFSGANTVPVYEAEL